MAASFKLDIVTPNRLLTSVNDAVWLMAPGSEGYFGLMAFHAPLIAELMPGELRVTHASGLEEIMAVSGGFAEVSNNHVTVLADTAERPDEIDVERARSAYKRASERLASSAPGLDVERARLAMLRAAARLTVAGQPVRG